MNVKDFGRAWFNLTLLLTVVWGLTGWLVTSTWVAFGLGFILIPLGMLVLAFGIGIIVGYFIGVKNDTK